MIIDPGAARVSEVTTAGLRLAIIAFLQTRAYGEADFKTTFFNLPKFIKLSTADREVARERPAEQKWHTIVRNVHRTLSKLPGSSDGILVARKGGGFQLASKVRKPANTVDAYPW